MPSTSSPGNVAGLRPAVLGLAKLVTLTYSTVAASPLLPRGHHIGNDEAEEEDAMPIWIYLVASVILTLVGGVFAGLTIALMGQDSIYLQVLQDDPTEPQHKNARRVLDLLKKGKHWVLVTLLLSNVIVNETLPVVLDRALGGGVAAVVGSTVLIVIFGEVIPQSLCVRYGLPIGGYMSKPVLGLMFVTGFISWPTAKLLDYLLGEDHGTVYKKSGLKTLVTLHKSLGELSERLNQDEVTIITAVLDLKAKAVSDVMTPMDDVFTLSEDHILDEKTMDKILHMGYSRIPVYRAGNSSDFVGILLVKTLITYDPEDNVPVKDVPLGAVVETRPETSCLDIINFFQEGKSHLVLVSEAPGGDHGALGVVTLEDVIEELIGEEIVDESDVYVDVHKAIRRLTPAPRARRIEATAAAAAAQKTTEHPVLVDIAEDGEGNTIQVGSYGAAGDGVNDARPRTAIFMKRRRSAGPDGRMEERPEAVRGSLKDVKQQMRLGPANRAAHPRASRRDQFKTKQGLSGQDRETPRSASANASSERTPLLDAEESGERPSRGKANGNGN